MYFYQQILWVLSSKDIPNQIIFHYFHCYHLMQNSTISHLDSLYSFLSGLLGSGVAPFQPSQSVLNIDTIILLKNKLDHVMPRHKTFQFLPIMFREITIIHHLL